jgi:5-methylcytosine-specific restriction enzyme subunit McrC
MNTVFERIVERGFRAIAQNEGSFRVDGQASIPNLVDGPHSVSMRPDVLIRTASGKPILVADAKWKTNHESPSSSDVYQLTSYILSLEVPGVLIYPGGSVKMSPSTVEGYSLHSFAVSTDADTSSYENYAQALEASVKRVFDQAIGEFLGPSR